MVDIRLPENDSGIILPFSDPRHYDDKPDVYVGSVLETGPECQWVTKGKKIAFQRFDYGSQSADVGEGFVLAHEKDVLVLGEDEAAPGVVAVNVIEEDSKNGIEIPDWVKMNNEAPTMIGQVVASGWKCTEECKNGCSKEHVNPQEIIIFRRLPEQQFRLGHHMVIFNNTCRHCRDHVKTECAADIILAKMEES